MERKTQKHRAYPKIWEKVLPMAFGLIAVFILALIVIVIITIAKTIPR